MRMILTSSTRDKSTHDLLKNLILYLFSKIALKYNIFIVEVQCITLKSLFNKSRDCLFLELRKTYF